MLWILTIGTSDVELRQEENWYELRGLVEEHQSYVKCDRVFEPPAKVASLYSPVDEDIHFYPVPTRVLGLVYGKDAQSYSKENYDSQYSIYEEDLVFPLLDVFIEQIKSRQKSNDELKVFILLTDQAQLFEDIIDDESRNCPYWQDTCTLEPILRWYFQDRLEVEPKFITIPNSEEERKAAESECSADKEAATGIDRWNDMLTVVKKKLSAIQCDDDETVYVSYQAGTPAISSAVQFVTISQFPKVEFLVSNRFYDGSALKEEAEVIHSSNYWKALQIEKAKKLIVEGEPGAALKVLEGIDGINQNVISKLKILVEQFNIKATVDDKTLEFKPDNAVERIRTALDMIEIFFDREKYIEGIVLLSAAQETFLKAAIMNYIKTKVPKKLGKASASDLVEWNEKGLIVKMEKDKSISEEDVKSLLKFPLKTIQKIQYKNELIKWLNNWAGDGWSWKLMDKQQQDVRNQLVHNLRGVEPSDVVQYLRGETIIAGKDITEKVVCVYRTEVKQPFVRAMKEMELLPEDEPEENKLSKDLEDLAAELDKVAEPPKADH